MVYVAPGSRTLGFAGDDEQKQWIADVAKAAGVLVNYDNSWCDQDLVEVVRWCNLWHRNVGEDLHSVHDASSCAVVQGLELSPFYGRSLFPHSGTEHKNNVNCDGSGIPLRASRVTGPSPDHEP